MIDNCIKRLISDEILKKFSKKKVILLFGARQVGKTTLLDKLVDHRNQKVLKLNADEAIVREELSVPNLHRLKNIIGSHQIVIIDEAQRVKEIGITLKLIHDHFKDIILIATGSSSFELANQVNEPLTGRKYEFHLYPISFEENVNHTNLLEEEKNLSQRLIYGSYPEIITHAEDVTEKLQLLADSYLYKDLFILDQIKKNTLLQQLLKALALQIGNEVSSNELASLLGASRNTIDKYIDLLEQTFIIFKLPALSRNLRNEIKKNKKIYFFDNGIRNAVIGNYNPIESRTDVGALWENYLISERIKYLNNHQLKKNYYFWRTTSQQEIDYIEENNNGYELFEFKWNINAKAKFPKTFLKSYSVQSKKIIHPKNYYEFLMS